MMQTNVIQFSGQRSRTKSLTLVAATLDRTQKAQLQHHIRLAAAANDLDRATLFYRLSAEFHFGDHIDRLDRKHFEPLMRRLIEMELAGLGYGWRLA